MKFPWNNKTGIPKAIAMLATAAILAFGLCTANVVLGVPGSESRWLKPLQYLIPLCSITVVGSLIALAVLFDLNKRRSRRRK